MSPAWQPRFADKSALFWPIAAASRGFAGCAEWPTVDEIAARLAGPAGVDFVLQPPRPRRARGPRDPGALYDAQIVGGRVPTRARSWHDLLNALVWARFPRAKRALHARQHRAIEARREPSAARLPAARSREQDAIAMVDEGGAAILCAGPSAAALAGALADGGADRGALVEAIARGAASPVLFGHALYERLVLEGPRVNAAAWVVPCDGALPAEDDARVGLVDAWLAEALARGWPESPATLGHVALSAIA